MKQLRVVVVAPEAPDPFGHAPARWYCALAKGLRARGHTGEFLCAYPPGTTEASLDRAKQYLAAQGMPLRPYPYPVRSFFTRKLNTIKRPYSHFISDELRTDVQQALRAGYDILNLEQMWAGYLGIGVERALVSVHHLELLDLDGVASGSLKSWVSKRLMFRAEREILARSQNIRVTTTRLSREVSRLNPAAMVGTVPVALDPDLYGFNTTAREPRTVGLIASFGWAPGYNAGVRLLTRIWPKLRKVVSGAKLLIVGWSARQAMEQFVRSDDVTVLENVPDTRDYFRRFCALLYPLSQGSGMKLKLLEAMAHGTPVVTTSEGAEGLDLEDGEHAMLADEDDVFVQKAARLMSDHSLRDHLSRAARALVEERYSPDPVVAQLERVYDKVLTSRRTSEC